MTRLPPIKVTKGQAFAYEATVTGQDWTGYTGEVVFKDKPKGTELLTATVTGDADGLMAFSLTATETEDLEALPVIGYRATGVFQITMTGADVKTYQGTVGVAGTV